MKYTNEFLEGKLFVCKNPKEKWQMSNFRKDVCTIIRMDKQGRSDDYPVSVITESLENGDWTLENNEIIYEIY